MDDMGMVEHKNLQLIKKNLLFKQINLHSARSARKQTNKQNELTN